MNFKKGCVVTHTILLICVARVNVGAGAIATSFQSKPDKPKPPEIASIAAEELKAKIAKNEPLTIIDVRATDAYVGSDRKIKGAIHVRFRRLQSRLSVPPLSDVPRTTEVVTYCACPNDETGIRAAEIFLAAGFKRVRILKGGWQAWLKAGGQMETKPKGM